MMPGSGAYRSTSRQSYPKNRWFPHDETLFHPATEDRQGPCHPENWQVSLHQRRPRPEPHLENFLESFASTARYVRYTPGMQVILTRDFLFGLFIAVVPALVPVVALQHSRL